MRLLVSSIFICQGINFLIVWVWCCDLVRPFTLCWIILYAFPSWFCITYACLLQFTSSRTVAASRLSLGGVMFASTGSHCNCVDFIMPEIRRMVLFNCTSILLTHRSTVFSSGTNKNQRNVSTLAPKLRTATFFADFDKWVLQVNHPKCLQEIWGWHRAYVMRWITNVSVLVGFGCSRHRREYPFSRSRSTSRFASHYIQKTSSLC
jgi:hypothetical protein